MSGAVEVQLSVTVASGCNKWRNTLASRSSEATVLQFEFGGLCCCNELNGLAAESAVTGEIKVVAERRRESAIHVHHPVEADTLAGIDN